MPGEPPQNPAGPPTLPTALPADGEVHVWAWRLDGPPPGEAALDAGERERADRFHFADDRRRFVAAHVGLRGLLAAATGGSPASLRFDIGEFGKPSLRGEQGPSAAFNLTHSGELAAVVLARTGEVGADVERHREVKQAEAIARRHFTPAESHAVLAASGGEHRRRFFDLWTAKEAVIKLLGSGLWFPLTAFETPGAIAQSGWIDLPAENPLRIDRCWLERIEIAAGYGAALALLEKPTAVRAHWLDLAAAGGVGA